MHACNYQQFTILHNGDYSGEARIRNNLTGEELEIPAAALFTFAANAARAHQIGRLESAPGAEILCIVLLLPDGSSLYVGGSSTNVFECRADEYHDSVKIRVHDPLTGDQPIIADASPGWYWVASTLGLPLCHGPYASENQAAQARAEWACRAPAAVPPCEQDVSRIADKDLDDYLEEN